jgi:LDH2 family malate/lactate/ureidoglycolate dehydrogenase
VKVAITEAKKMLEEFYSACGLDGSATDWMVELSLDRDLTGNYFSGFSATAEGVQKLNYTAQETYEVDRPALKLINGNGKPAKLIMKDIIPKATQWAKEQGQIWVGFKNCDYHGSLDTIARKFAEQDLVCIYASNGGPQGVVPYGGTKDIFGTNPMAYGIPTHDVPIVFDAATAKYAIGTIKRAREMGQRLEEETYLDAVGAYTTDPEKAVALIPFGGYKGYAINLLLDVLTGALVGGVSGSLQRDVSEIGGFLLLIDPSAFGPIDMFKSQVDQIVKDIQNNPPAPCFTEVRVPGHRAASLRARQLAEGSIEVQDSVWNSFVLQHRQVTTR